ncbi:MAG: hypothetical protein ABL934_00585 [Lysobacteraceae bacterium]
MNKIFRGNSRLAQRIGADGVDFLEHAAGAVDRLMPHLEVSAWTEGVWSEARASWTSKARDELLITLAIGQESDAGSRSLSAIANRRHGGKAAGYTVSPREHSLCDLIAKRISNVMGRVPVQSSDGVSIRTLRDAFDEHVIASHLQAQWEVLLPVGSVLRELHKLSEQSYENKSYSFGCILDKNLNAVAEGADLGSFPREFLQAKRYKALSDGFRTAYVVSANGEVADLVDLEQFEREKLTEKHFFPNWSERIARASRAGRYGIALSRQGDILIFEEGTLRFSYRFGRWQFWNHRFLLELLHDQARAHGVNRSQLGRVIGPIYRAALDISFRRSGGLFVILRNRNNARKLVRSGDGIGDDRRLSADADFDGIFNGQTIRTLHRAIAVELASLDGAIVIDNTGRIRAYGAVLKSGGKAAKKGKRVEGSRTQAAIAASHFGLAIKISSDGDNTVFANGREFISV